MACGSRAWRVRSPQWVRTRARCHRPADRPRLPWCHQLPDGERPRVRVRPGRSLGTGPVRCDLLAPARARRGRRDHAVVRPRCATACHADPPVTTTGPQADLALTAVRICAAAAVAAARLQHGCTQTRFLSVFRMQAHRLSVFRQAARQPVFWGHLGPAAATPARPVRPATAALTRPRTTGRRPGVVGPNPLITAAKRDPSMAALRFLNGPADAAGWATIPPAPDPSVNTV